ncbi:MAG: signal peptidase I [Ruminococcaceae bacterium]|nr:signal peptidase I [Oscillospiraceae bacterium]
MDNQNNELNKNEQLNRCGETPNGDAPDTNAASEPSQNAEHPSDPIGEAQAQDAAQAQDVAVAQDAAQTESFGFRAFSSVFDILEILVVSILIVLVAFTFCFRLCRVSGDSMDVTLENGETLITSDLFYEPKQGDIVVFHLSNGAYFEPLVKRVIALEGQTVTVNISTGETFVDGELLDEDYAYFGTSDGYDKTRIRNLFDFSYVTIDEQGHQIFSATVPKGKIFVMGDNRNNSSDSRNHLVGFIDKDTVLGKALFRLSPFKAID